MPSDVFADSEVPSSARERMSAGADARPQSFQNVMLAIVAAAVLAGAGLFAFSPQLAAHPLSIFAYSAALASAVLLIFYVVAQRRRARSGALGVSGAEAFPQALAMTDLDGEIISTREGAVGTIGSLANAPDELVFRIGRLALEQGAAYTDVDNADGVLGGLLAFRVGDERLMWGMASRIEDICRIQDVSDASTALFSESGELLYENQRFAEESPHIRDMIDRMIDERVFDDSGSRLLSPRELAGERRNVLLLRCGAKGVLAIGFPAAADDDVGASALFDRMPVAAAELTPEGVVVKVNAAAKRLVGASARPGARIGDLVEGLSRPIIAKLRETADGLGSARPELTRRMERPTNSAGTRDEVFLQVAMTRVSESDASSIIAVFNDATELKVLEQQFVQSQKMQAVGQLAGGVAHDFNNLLTAILGHCDLMATRMDETAADFEDLTQIRQNANRAAALVRQLLAFSRQQKLNPTRCKLGDVLGELSNLLDRLIGEKVALDVVTEDGLWDVFLDAQQFEQVILNLVVNARDAMPDGGCVRISCSNAHHETECKRDRAVVSPGDYVVVEIADDGVGMTEDIREKVFEPFFTTKGVGEGTGLGLSTVYGIIKQTGGFIFIDSEPGVGTTFRILFPRSEEDVEPARPRTEDAKIVTDLSGRGRILLVEDEAPVRTFARRALSLRGYEVIEAVDGESALAILQDPDLSIDLAISDVVMPGGDGPSWVREARKARPDMPVVFTSGYSEDILRKGVGDIGNCTFLPKPFSLDELARVAKERVSRDGEDGGSQSDVQSL